MNSTAVEIASGHFLSFTQRENFNIKYPNVYFHISNRTDSDGGILNWQLYHIKHHNMWQSLYQNV
jgi:hypothetical protein